MRPLAKTHIWDIHGTETFPTVFTVPRVATLHSQENQKLQINPQKVTRSYLALSPCKYYHTVFSDR